MYQHKLILSAIAVLAAIDLVGQDLSSKSLKLNLQQTFNQEDGSTGLGIAPVLMYKTRKNNYHEFELTLSRKKYEESFYNSTGSVARGDVKEFRLGIRHQYTVMFMKKSGSRLLPGLGFSSLSLYSRDAIEPTTTNWFPSVTNQFNEILTVAPLIRYTITERVFATVEVPLHMFNVEIRQTRISNPALPISQQRRTVHKGSYDQSRIFQSARLGVGIQL